MTADILDASQEIEQNILDARIEALRATAPKRNQPKGFCQWCNEPFASGDERIFCDSDCSEDYEKYKQQQR